MLPVPWPTVAAADWRLSSSRWGAGTQIRRSVWQAREVKVRPPPTALGRQSHPSQTPWRTAPPLPTVLPVGRVAATEAVCGATGGRGIPRMTWWACARPRGSRSGGGGRPPTALQWGGRVGREEMLATQCPRPRVPLSRFRIQPPAAPSLWGLWGWRRVATKRRRASGQQPLCALPAALCPGPSTPDAGTPRGDPRPSPRTIPTVVTVLLSVVAALSPCAVARCPSGWRGPRLEPATLSPQRPAREPYVGTSRWPTRLETGVTDHVGRTLSTEETSVGMPCSKARRGATPRQL